MAGTQPVGVYALKVPPGDTLIPAVPDFTGAMFRVSMAAIDPSAEPEHDVDDKKPLRATLKLVRFPMDDLSDDSDDEDYDDPMLMLDDEDEDEDDEEDEVELNGGPSTKSKKKQSLAMAEDEDEEDSDDEEDDEAAARAILAKLKKGKAKSNGAEDEGSDEDDDDESMEVEEIVVCTLDPEKNYQQPIDLTVGDDERIFFKVSGTHTIHLTGNYLIPTDGVDGAMYDEDEDDEDDYDLSPDEDELDYGDEESDDLDDLADPRVMELGTDEEEAPALVKAAGSKGKNKRPAEDSADEMSLDDIIAKTVKPETVAADGEKLSKSQLKKLKKQKKNDGEAKAVSPEAVKATANGAEKKSVQFAKNLEQGPTPSPAAAKEDKKEAATTGTVGVKTVQGVTIDDKKLGKGPGAKKGDRVGMRYIGKLENGKIFDSNKKGKPFAFKLGSGEVIKGWDIGIAGLAVGGERRITIPAHLGYGSKGAPPDIPGNSKLIFDVKMLEIK